MTWSRFDLKIVQSFVLLLGIIKSLVFRYRVSIKGVAHYFLRIWIVISWTWILIFPDERETFHIFSADSEGKPFWFLVLLFGIMIEISLDSWCVSGCGWDIWFNIKDNIFLAYSKTCCFFTDSRRNIIEMIRIINLSFDVFLLWRIKSLCFTEGELIFRWWVI